MPFHTPLARWVGYTSPAEVKDVPFVDSVVARTPAGARRGAYEIGCSHVCPGQVLEELANVFPGWVPLLIGVISDHQVRYALGLRTLIVLDFIPCAPASKYQHSEEW